jgi:hypothetical protein
VRLRGTKGCWTGTLDATPGLADGESPGGASRRIPVCAGETIAVRLRTAPGGQPAHVWIDSDSGSSLSGHQLSTIPPGATGTVYDTAPPGTHTMNVTLGPGIEGGRIASARTGVLGHCLAR